MEIFVTELFSISLFPPFYPGVSDDRTRTLRLRTASQVFHQICLHFWQFNFGT